MKRANINLIMSLLIVLSLFTVTGLCFFLSGRIDSEILETTGNSMKATMQQGEIDDVEGYGLIVQGLGYGFSFLGYLVFLVLAVISGGYGLIMLLFAVIARIFYSKERLLAYRILMGIVLAMQFLLELFILTVLISEIALFWVITEIVLVGITVFCAINTYTSPTGQKTPK